MTLRPRYTCHGCESTWTGLSQAHCGSCHELFASVSGFDAHRRDVRGVGTCLDPAVIVATRGARKGEPVLAFRDGMWRSAQEFTQAGALFGGGE